MRQTNLRIVFCLISISIIGLGGCSDRKEKLVDVTGKVTYNGAILDKPGGEICFVGPSGTQAVTKIEADGSYHARNVSCGMNRVAVYYRNADAKIGKPFPTRPKPNEPPPPPPKASTDSPWFTPAKYASVDTSELSIDVNEGTTFDVDMKGPKIP